MPSLVVIGQQIKEKQRGAQCALPACIVPKYSRLNRIKPSPNPIGVKSNPELEDHCTASSDILHWP